MAALADSEPASSGVRSFADWVPCDIVLAGLLGRESVRVECSVSRIVAPLVRLRSMKLSQLSLADNGPGPYGVIRLHNNSLA